MIKLAEIPNPIMTNTRHNFLNPRDSPLLASPQAGSSNLWFFWILSSSPFSFIRRNALSNTALNGEFFGKVNPNPFLEKTNVGWIKQFLYSLCLWAVEWSKNIVYFPDNVSATVSASVLFRLLSLSRNLLVQIFWNFSDVSQKECKYECSMVVIW